MRNKKFDQEIPVFIFRCLLIFTCFIPLFVFRDFTPNNELKYLSIADEAIRDGHFFAFWNHGTVYADKPPLYLWIVMLGRWMTGSHSMFFLSLFSILPAFVVLYVMDKWVATTLPSKLRQSGLLMLITSGLFAGSALVLRMDMLMCMFIVLSLYSFYKQYTGIGGRKEKILLPVYIFLAIFSKGPVGILIPLLSITVFLIVKKEIRSFGKYLGWLQFSVLIGLCALWFAAVYIEGGKAYLNNLLFNQTVNRAIDSFHHKEPFWYYFKTIWYSLAPWTLFYIATIIIGLKKRVITTDAEKLFLVVITTTFTALSLFSGKLDIYMLPMFPFIAYLSFLVLPKINQRFIYITIALPAIILILAFPSLFILERYIEFPIFSYPTLPAGVLILSASAGISLVLLFRKHLLKATNALSIGILLTILTASFAIPKLNNYIGFGNLAREAQKIGNQRGIRNYFFYQFRSGENIDSYLNQDIKNITSDQLVEMEKIQDFMLLMETEDIDSTNDLYKIIHNKERYRVGNYSIIVFDIN